MKVELFMPRSQRSRLTGELRDFEERIRLPCLLLAHAKEFALRERLRPAIAMIGDTIDLVHNGIELGSYLYVQRGSMSWVCGTGCAEPRWSQALASKG
jgi:hypothetical protein